MTDIVVVVDVIGVVVVIVLATAIRDQHLPFGIHVTEGITTRGSYLGHSLIRAIVLSRLYQSHFLSEKLVTQHDLLLLRCYSPSP